MSIQAMNTTIKNNTLIRSKRKKFKNRLGGYNSNIKTDYNLPKASNKQLKEIAKRLKEEHKLRMLKVVLLTCILVTVLIGVFLFSSDGIIELLTY